MAANLIGGVMMWAVHFLSKRIPESEYGVLVTLFALTMVVPILPLQMVFAQQTAKALASGHRAQLARLIRWSALVAFTVWLVWAGTMALFHKQLIATWQIANPAAFWATLGGLLGALILPMLWGLLQGKQDFLSLGWSMILTALGRFGGALLIVLMLGGYAAGIMSAVVLGFVLNRLNVSLTGFEASSGVSYFPSWVELAVTAMLVAVGFLAFGLAAKHLPVFHAAATRPVARST